MNRLPIISEVGDLEGRRVLLRLDLNLPVINGAVADSYRFERSRKTIDYLIEKKARVIIASHFESKESKSIKPVFEFLRRKLPIEFAANIEDAKAALSQRQNLLLLENLRLFDGEKENSPEFAKGLASIADLYVDEAFSASHRRHASIVGVPKLLPSFVGFLFEEEVERLSEAFDPPRSALLILGGAKFETKVPLVRKFLSIMDNVYVCGALANDVYKARGYEIGVSLVSDSKLDSLSIDNSKFQVPSDVIVKTATGTVEKGADAVSADEKIVDAGLDAISDLRALIQKAEFVLWNGPLGEYEAGFDKGTIAVAQALAESEAETIIGGGDSLAVVSKLGLLERFSFVSTGGGAMLDFLANGTLPGIEALKRA